MPRAHGAFAALLGSRVGAMMTQGSLFGRRRGRGIDVRGSIASLAVLALVLGGGLYGFYYLVIETFTRGDAAYGYFSVVALFGMVICLVFSMPTTQATLYDAGDGDMLLSMPIPTWQILSSRIAAMLLLDAVYMATSFVPGLIVWQGRADAPDLDLVGFLSGFVLLTLLVRAILDAVAFAAQLLTARLPHRALAHSLLEIGMTVGGLAWLGRNGSRATGGIADELMAMSEPMRAVTAFRYACSGDASGTLLCLAVCLAAFASSYALVRIPYRRMLLFAPGPPRGRATRRVSAHGVRAALLSRELRRFAASSAWMLNTLLSVVFGAVAPTVMSANVGALRATLATASPVLATDDMIAWLSTLLFCLFAFSVNVSAMSVPFEKGSLWLIRSAPVRTRDVLVAKIECHLVLESPIVLSSAVAAALLPMGAADAVLMVAAVSLASLLSAVGGLALGLRNPNMAWVSEADCIRGEHSGHIVCIIGLVLAEMPIVWYVGGFPAASVLPTMCAFLALATLSFVRPALVTGVRRFEDLPA